MNREVVLPVAAERAWELITEPDELEAWLADEVEFEPARGRAAARSRCRTARSARASSRRSQPSERIVVPRGATRASSVTVELPGGRRHPLRVTERTAGPCSSGRACWPRRRTPRCARPERANVDAVFAALADPTRRAGPALAVGAARRPPPAGRRAADHPPGRAKHLARCTGAGLVEPRREGRETRYTLTPAPLADAMGWMAEVGADWDERLARSAARRERASRPLPTPRRRVADCAPRERAQAADRPGRRAGARRDVAAHRSPPERSAPSPAPRRSPAPRAARRAAWSKRARGSRTAATWAFRARLVHVRSSVRSTSRTAGGRDGIDLQHSSSFGLQRAVESGPTRPIGGLDRLRARRRSGGRSTPARASSRRSRATGTCRRRLLAEPVDAEDLRQLGARRCAGRSRASGAK